MEPTAIKEKVRAYLQNQYFSQDQDGLKDDTPLLSAGIIDSISALQLVEHLESEFNFEFEAHEVDQENLDTVDRIVNFVVQKTK